MRVPERLEPLLDHGVIEEVLRPLQSGKEAEVYLVICQGEERVAKVYKNAQHRSFQHRAEYTEGRRVRSSREQRAMNKQSRHGKAKTEEAWRSAEADAIHVLRAAGVRVPAPIVFTDGVLVMELVTDAQGQPAPRMVDIHFTPEEAVALFHVLVREVVKMLCAGIIHADLSDFNVLISADGPVIIDFPQAVDPARNQSAQKLLIRDVDNLTGFLGRFAPELRSTKYGPEMWDLYERSELDPTTELTGKFEPVKETTEVSSLLEDILALEKEARERREALGLPPPRRVRRVPDPPPEPQPRPRPPKADKPTNRRGGGPPPAPAPAPAPARRPPTGDAPEPDQKKRRRRRKRGPGDQPPGGNSSQGEQAAQPPRPRPPASPEAQGPPSDGPERAGPPKRRRRRRRGGGKPGGGSDGGGGQG